MQQNPFIYRTPVVGADFYNREDIIEKILNVTVANRAKGSVWLVGSRQVGKSSLLQHIETNYRDYDGKATFQNTEQVSSIAFIYVNCQADRNADDFYYSLTRGLIDRFSFRIKKENLDNYAYFIEWLKKLHKESIYVVFLIDEFDALMQSFIQDNEQEAANFLDRLNVDKEKIREIKDSPKVFSCVWTANLSLKEIVQNINLNGSGLMVNDKLELTLFDKNQIFELAQQYLQETELQFTQEELDCCYQHTKGYPVLVQTFLYILFEQKYCTDNAGFSLKQVKKLYQSKANDLIDDLGARKNMSNATIKALKRLGLKEVSFLGFKFDVGKY